MPPVRILRPRALVLVAAALVVLAGSAALAGAAGTRPGFCLVTDRAHRAGGYRSLQEAIDAAGSGDTLVVKGTCTGSSEIVRKDLTIVGKATHGFGAPTLDGGADGTVLTVGTPEHPNVPVVVVVGMTITNGGAFGISNNGTVTLDDVTVRDNAGAGLDNAGVLTAEGSTVSGNRGGGISNRAGSAVLTDSLVQGNSSGADGGGIFNRGTLTLTRSTVTTNVAAGEGGGIFNLGTLTMTGSEVSANTSGGVGGGISSHGTVAASASAIDGNTAALGGGGMYDSPAGGGSITDSTVHANVALDGLGYGTNVGGGIADCSGSLALSGTTVSESVPDDFGTAYCPGLGGPSSPAG